MEKKITAQKNGYFKFTVITGEHYIATYIDVNKDWQYQDGEHGIYYGLPTKISVSAKQVVKLGHFSIQGLPQLKKKSSIDRRNAFWNNVGRVVTLDFDKFIRENYDLGLWKPFDFLDIAEGGVFFLEEYSSEKMPVFLYMVPWGDQQILKM